MKYYSCPVCKITSSGKLWNESTIEKYGNQTEQELRNMAEMSINTCV